MKEVRIPVDGGALAGTLFVPTKSSSEKQPGALLIHGWDSSQISTNDTAELLCRDLGIACLTIDLRGHGKSDGDRYAASAEQFLHDIFTAYDFLLTQGVEPQNIGVIGSSFGSYLAALLSVERTLAWMVLRVPANYPDETFMLPRGEVSVQGDMDEWRRRPQEWDATATLRAIHIFSGGVFIVEAENDLVIPKQTVLNYKNAMSDQRRVTYMVMKDAPHSFTGHPVLKKQYNEMIVEWLKRYVTK